MPACAARYPHRTWRDLCVAGAVTQNLADHVPVAWRWGEDVQALGSGERSVWAAASVRRAQAQGCGTDWPELSDIVIQEAGLDGFWIPPGAAVRRDPSPV